MHRGWDTQQLRDGDTGQLRDGDTGHLRDGDNGHLRDGDTQQLRDVVPKGQQSAGRLCHPLVGARGCSAPRSGGKGVAGLSLFPRPQTGSAIRPRTLSCPLRKIKGKKVSSLKVKSSFSKC